MAFALETIPDADVIYRHVPKAKVKPEVYWVVEQNRPSSAAFKDKKGRPSVNWERYGTVEGTRRPNSLAVVALFAGQCREQGKQVEHVPISEEEEGGPNQAHAEICDLPGPPMTHEKEVEVRDELARASRLVWMAPGEPNFV